MEPSSAGALQWGKEAQCSAASAAVNPTLANKIKRMPVFVKTKSRDKKKAAHLSGDASEGGISTISNPLFIKVLTLSK